MASSSSQRVVHQDYIARIRYSNALPPPPNPPKLLDIPNTGLSSGQYTTPGFASRLARDQPLNIEADAELGMPLDLVGMPGIFDGDESSIQAPLHPPAPHPHDRALLRPLASLGKPKFSDSGVSFLRRTEYISSYTSKSRFDSVTSRSLIGNTGGNRPKRAAPTVDKESPEYIKEMVEKSFQIAANNVQTKAVVHPAKRHLKLVDAYPLLPDLTSFPDPGGYATIKFTTNPVPPSSVYDARLECSLLVPNEVSEEEIERRRIMQEAYEMDPERNPVPDKTQEYEFFMPESQETARKFKRKFDTLDPDNEDEDLYTLENSEGQGCFRFKRIRAYESQVFSGSQENKYSEEVVIAIHDGKDGLRSKGAYYYPIVQKIAIRPQRTKNINQRRGGGASQPEDAPTAADLVELRVVAPDEKTKRDRDVFITQPYGAEGDDDEDLDGEGEADD